MELVCKVENLKMTGVGEGKTCYMYRRVGRSGPGAEEKLSNGEPCDRLFRDPCQIILKGRESVKQAITNKAGKWLNNKDPARERKSLHKSLGGMC